jgi:topoisomerase-4 subunit A
VKRFAVTSITRDKDYYLGSEAKGTKVLYLSVNPNGEAERLRIALRPKPKLRRLIIDFDFATLEIKGRAAKGNILTRHAVRNVIKKEAGVSTLKARDIFYDDSVMRLNTDGRGRLLGSFESDDRIIIINQTGHYRTIVPELTLHFEEDLILIDRFDPEQPLTVIYRQIDSGQYFIKRFVPEQSEKKSAFLGDDANNQLIAFSLDYLPRLMVRFDTAANKKEIPDEDIAVADFIETKSIKAKGKKISSFVISKIEFIDPYPYELDEEESDAEEETAQDDIPEPEVTEDGTIKLKFD